MDKFIVWLLTYVWNWIYEYQRPVAYAERETDNNYNVKHTDENSNFQCIFEVKQIKLLRKPKRPFYGKFYYQYEVNQYVFAHGKFVNKVTVRYPEYSHCLFRNTKIPHVLAINAFLDKQQVVGGNKVGK